MEVLLKRIPKEFRQIFTDIVELTDKFCEDHLNEDYQQLARDMAIKLCRKGSPVTQGKARSWACGVVHALGWVNFLHDRNTKPYLSSADLAEGFGVSQGTMLAKSKKIRELLKLMPLHPGWCISVLIDDNPLVWMVEINGFVMDMRTAPREFQEAAYAKGLIPYIPDDQEDSVSDDEDNTETLKFPTSQQEEVEPDPDYNSRNDEPMLF
jgi:hypothetical protein